VVAEAARLMLAAPARWLDELAVAPLCAGALDFLPRSFDAARGLCSFKAELRDGVLVQDWDNRFAPRYTITSLLGLNAVGYDRADGLTERFLALNDVTNPADQGLLTLLHCERGDAERAAALVPALRALASAPLEMQDLAWLVWGASAATRAGIAGAEPAARALVERMLRDYVDPRTGLPRHSLRRYRRGIVSFGSLVYYLRALHETAMTFGDPRAERLFREGVAATLALQGPHGEWPWMIDVARGRAFDRYPVFSVHQDSMSILFLRPALAQGLPGVTSAIERSIRWVHGENELGLRFYVDEPCFFAYRAIERDERWTKARRYGRWAARRHAATAPPERLRVNRECRSYHLGWLLYAWSGWV
jgi:hypothetical protein